MSLEAALAENTAAHKMSHSLFETLIATLKETNAGRDAAVAKLTDASGAATPATRRGRPPKATDAPAAETAPAPAPEEKVVEQPAAAAAAPAAPAALTLADVKKVCGDYMEAAEPERTVRRSNFKAILEHLGIKQIVEASESDYANIIKWVTSLKNTGSVNLSEGEDDQPEDDMLG